MSDKVFLIVNQDGKSSKVAVPASTKVRTILQKYSAANDVMTLTSQNGNSKLAVPLALNSNATLSENGVLPGREYAADVTIAATPFKGQESKPSSGRSSAVDSSDHPSVSFPKAYIVLSKGSDTHKISVPLETPVQVLIQRFIPESEKKTKYAAFLKRPQGQKELLDPELSLRDCGLLPGKSHISEVMLVEKPSPQKASASPMSKSAKLAKETARPALYQKEATPDVTQLRGELHILAAKVRELEYRGSEAGNSARSYRHTMEENNPAPSFTDALILHQSMMSYLTAQRQAHIARNLLPSNQYTPPPPPQQLPIQASPVTMGIPLYRGVQTAPTYTPPPRSFTAAPHYEERGTWLQEEEKRYRNSGNYLAGPLHCAMMEPSQIHRKYVPAPRTYAEGPRTRNNSDWVETASELHNESAEHERNLWIRDI